MSLCGLSDQQKEQVARVGAAGPSDLDPRVALAFFELSVTCSADHATGLHLPGGVVNWPIDVVAFGPADIPAVHRIARPR